MPLKFEIPKFSMTLVKNIIYVIGIVFTIFYFFRDKAVKEALMENQMKTTIENQENIMEKLKEIDTKFEKQSELNGKVLMYIDLTAPK
jgi:hypothetical protein